MDFIAKHSLKGIKSKRSVVSNLLIRKISIDQTVLPCSADVVVIGGGSAGCHALYFLKKKGVNAVLIEQAKLTSGTTWHTAGLVWSLRPNDVDIQLLTSSRNLLDSLECETGLHPGWIKNGGIFIAHSKTRLDEYKRLASIGNSLGIENHILTPLETKKIFPLLNEKSFIGALYSPNDGVVDPAMLCAALKSSAIKNGGKVFEDCNVQDISIEHDPILGKKVTGLSTTRGYIKTNNIINATGVWSYDLMLKYNLNIPLIPMRHAYIVSQSIPGVRGLPNIRDHDFSIYLRIQGESICMGGYETNPIIIDKMPKDFAFSLYDLDWTVFEEHMKGAISLCPVLDEYGIKSTVCGPESFTPDHKPLMGPDPNLHGLFYSCGYNSAGMMFGAGCAEQIVSWIINGKPDLHMFEYDINRFSIEEKTNKNWIKERSHESYTKNYSLVFKHDQRLSGRNLKKDPLHDDMILNGAYMEEKHGWERPGFFLKNEIVKTENYDWYKNYGFTQETNVNYKKIVDGDLRYDFSVHHNLIRQEALACRNNAVVFNMSYFCKMFLEGPEAEKAANWIFSAKTDREIGRIVYTCALNVDGGVEADVTISKELCPGSQLNTKYPINFRYYIVAGGASAAYTYSHIQREIKSNGFNAFVRDVTADYGVISIQGPKSREILQKIINISLNDESLPQNRTELIKILSNNKSYTVRILRVSFVGELGYELHIPKNDCTSVYHILMEAGKYTDLQNAGYRALYSLSSEKGYHLWGFDLRSDDTPVEANLGFTCRKKGIYKGKNIIEKQKLNGVNKKLVYFTLKEQIPIWGLEGVYRNGEPISYIRRAEYTYTLGKSLGQSYIQQKNGQIIDNDFITSGKYEIDVLGKLYAAECHLRSPFDPQSKRVQGIYN